jgi:hypothetical protein
MTGLPVAVVLAGEAGYQDGYQLAGYDCQQMRM